MTSQHVCWLICSCMWSTPHKTDGKQWTYSIVGEVRLLVESDNGLWIWEEFFLDVFTFHEARTADTTRMYTYSVLLAFFTVSSLDNNTSIHRALIRGVWNPPHHGQLQVDSTTSPNVEWGRAWGSSPSWDMVLPHADTAEADTLKVRGSRKTE